MNVLLVTQEFPPDVLGGVGYHAYYLADALTERGHDVHVLTGWSASHGYDDSNPDLPDVSRSTLSYRRTVAPRLWFARKAGKWLRSWDRLDEFDLLHAHEYLDFSGLAFEGTTVQKVHFNLTEKPAYVSLPRIPWPVDALAFGAARATIWRGERRLERRAIKTADVTIANSRLTRDRCTERHALDGSDICVVYNGVDVERFTPPAGETDDDYLLFVGGDQERKGFSRVLAALEHLEPWTDIAVKIAGSAGSVETARLESALSVEFLGTVPQNQLEEEYRNAAALVHPALYEPFGNVVLESLACGTPVVIADPAHCGVAELIGEETGLIVDPENVTDLAEAMVTACGAPDRFAPTACRTLAERHTWDHVAERTVDLVRDVGG